MLTFSTFIFSRKFHYYNKHLYNAISFLLNDFTPFFLKIKITFNMDDNLSSKQNKRKANPINELTGSKVIVRDISDNSKNNKPVVVIPKKIAKQKVRNKPHHTIGKVEVDKINDINKYTSLNYIFNNWTTLFPKKVPLNKI